MSAIRKRIGLFADVDMVFQQCMILFKHQRTGYG